MDRLDDTVLERLRAMRSLAIVKDAAALVQQVERLRTANALDARRLDALDQAIQQSAYGTAVALIETLLADANAVADVPSSTADPTQAAGGETTLQADVERLEEKLSELEQEEAELQRLLHRFNARYRDELGPLVSTLLRLRKDQLEQSLYARRSDRQRRRAYNKAEAQFEQFQSVLEATDEAPLATISEEEQARLKATYRRASKLCHPDMVDASVEEEARDYFNALREAYQHNDVARVEAIAETLDESGFGPRAEASSKSDRSQLMDRAARLRRRIASVEEALDALRATEAHQVLQQTDDLDAYFDALKARLRREIRQLRRGQPVPPHVLNRGM